MNPILRSMSSSLRDQLLKAGLVDKIQVKQAKQQQRQQSRDKNGPVAEQKLAARQAEAAKAARDQELNRRQQEKMQHKARMARVKQLIEHNRLPRVDSDEYYNFIDGKQIKRVAVNAEIRNRLIRGGLFIVRYEGHYEVVPEAVAQRIRECDEHVVIACNATTASHDENDPYRDYVVPDDLIW